MNKNGIKHRENKKQNDRCKLNDSSNNIKCEWIKQFCQEAEIVILDKK